MRILLYSVLIVFCFISCKGKEDEKKPDVGYYIRQYFGKSWDGTTDMNTLVYLNDELLKAWSDNVQGMKDSTDYYRIQEAKTYIEWLKSKGRDTIIYVK